MESRGGLKVGMTVRSTDGEKLGKIIKCEGNRFLIEKGMFFKTDYQADYDRVERIEGDEVIYASRKDELANDGRVAGAHRGAAVAPAGAAGLRHEGEPIGGAPERRAAADEVTIPLVEEELTAEKTRRPAGEVRIHKEIKTEQKQVTVPVTHEEVRVERVRTGAPPAPGEDAFKGETVSIPLEEEEVEFHKRPVVREELHVRKEAHEEQRVASESVRREEAYVEGERTRSTEVEHGEGRDDPNRRT